jgi:hypothetical protein
VDPYNSLVYMWINGHDVRMHQRRRRHRYQYRFVRILQHSTFPLGCVPISGHLQCAIFHANNGYAKMQRSRATIPEHVREMKTMNRGVEQNEQSQTIARGIWECKAISWVATDGSVRDPSNRYLFICYIYLPNRCENDHNRWWIPSTDCSVLFGSVFETSRSSSATCWAYMDTETSSQIP